MKRDDFIFALNIDCGYTLEPALSEAVLTSTHNLCFRAKIRKNEYPCKWGVRGCTLRGHVSMMVAFRQQLSRQMLF